MTNPSPPTKEKSSAADLPKLEGDAIRRGGGIRIASGAPVALDPRQVSRDVRARRPRLLAALLQARAPQRLARVVSLLALDLAAVWSSIFTALAVKELIRGNFVLERVSEQTWEYLPF